MTYKPRDLGASLGRSIPNEGRVVIYKPKAAKGKNMAFGKAISSYDLSVDPTTVENALKRSIEGFYRSVGGKDSYGRTNAIETIYRYPSLEPHAVKARNVPAFKGEIKGLHGDFYRFGDSNTWVPASQVTELTQDAIIYQISKVASDVVVKYFNDPEVDKAGILANISQTAKDLLPTVVNALGQNEWFKKWGIKIG